MSFGRLPSSIFFLYAILIPCLFFSCGCSKSTAEPSSDILSIYLGIRENDIPFLENDTQFSKEASFLGKISSPQGSQAKMVFTKLSGSEVVKLDLVIKESAEGVYTLEGTYTAKEAFVLVLQGTNEDEKKDSELPFPAGTGKVSFTGKLFYTFDKQPISSP